MALVRVASIQGVSYGSGPTAFTGITGAGWNHKANVITDRMAGDYTNTIADIVGWRTGGFIETSDITNIQSLQGLAYQALIITYRVSTSAANQGGSGTFKKRTFTNVRFGTIESINIEQGEASGKAVRYRIAFEVIYATANTKPSDVFVIATVN